MTESVKMYQKMAKVKDHEIDDLRAKLDSKEQHTSKSVKFFSINEACSNRYRIG